MKKQSIEAGGRSVAVYVVPSLGGVVALATRSGVFVAYQGDAEAELAIAKHVAELRLAQERK